MSDLLTAPAETAPTKAPRFSLVLETPPAARADAEAHFAARLTVETDPSDVHADLAKGVRSFVVVDVRSPEHYAACHVPGAINLPYRRITAETTADLSRDTAVVVYCWGPGCNAATKGGARLAALGFAVKEMIGGIEYWRREGYSVDGTEGDAAPLYG
ncbi:MAG: rhodanese-like domain-containing protein [Rubricoccaceae bacterium]